MGFSRKRDSWANRPLSMILPDGFSLFKKQAAVGQSSHRKALANGTDGSKNVSTPVATGQPVSSPSNQAAPSHHSRHDKRKSMIAPSVTQTQQPQQLQKAPEFKPLTPPPRKEFLTLDLDSHSLVPEQYLDRTVLENSVTNQEQRVTPPESPDVSLDSTSHVGHSSTIPASEDEDVRKYPLKAQSYSSFTSDSTTADVSTETVASSMILGDRKVEVRRGVYIFDAAANGQSLLMSPDEAYNPFDYE